MFRRRRFWFMLLVGLVFAAATFYVYLLNHALWASRADYISRGMKREEVIALLGRQPDFTNRLSSVNKSRDRWEAIDGDIILTYDAEDRVQVIGGQRHWMILYQLKRLISHGGL